VRRSGYIETVTEGGHVVGDTTQEEDVPLVVELRDGGPGVTVRR
jgi:hypothetical protein